MLVSRPVNKTAYIVITSDRGLVGGYNASILKTMMEMKAEYHPTGDDFEVICIGSVGAVSSVPVGFNRFMVRGLPDQPSFKEVRKDHFKNSPNVSGRLV